MKFNVRHSVLPEIAVKASEARQLKKHVENFAVQFRTPVPRACQPPVDARAAVGATAVKAVAKEVAQQPRARLLHRNVAPLRQPFGRHLMLQFGFAQKEQQVNVRKYQTVSKTKLTSPCSCSA